MFFGLGDIYQKKITVCAVDSASKSNNVTFCFILFYKVNN